MKQPFVSTPETITLIKHLLWWIIFGIKTVSAQSSNNKCENYLLKLYSLHANLFKYYLKHLTVFDFCRWPRDKIPKHYRKKLTNIARMLNACCIVFLLQGQLESLNLVKCVLPLFKILPCYEAILVTLFFCYYCSIVLRKSSEQPAKNLIDETPFCYEACLNNF